MNSKCFRKWINFDVITLIHMCISIYLVKKSTYYNHSRLFYLLYQNI